jgi:hypothetical protein
MNQMQGWYEFSDEELTMQVPGYLRPKKGVRYFTPRGRRGRGQHILGIAVVDESPEGADAIRAHLGSARFVDWQDVKQRAVRRGETRFVADGYELLSTSYNTSTHESLHRYDVVFGRLSRYVHLSISGRGEIADFDDVCREIASSIRLKPTAEDRNSAAQDRPAPTEAANVGPSLCHEAPRMCPGTYLVARVKANRRPVDFAVIIGDPVAGGVRLYLLARVKRKSFPCGSTWHETEDAARAEAMESLGIGESDWEVREGEPEWAPAFLEAAQDAIAKHIEGEHDVAQRG